MENYDSSANSLNSIRIPSQQLADCSSSGTIHYRPTGRQSNRREPSLNFVHSTNTVQLRLGNHLINLVRPASVRRDDCFIPGGVVHRRSQFHETGPFRPQNIVMWTSSRQLINTEGMDFNVSASILAGTKPKSFAGAELFSPAPKQTIFRR